MIQLGDVVNPVEHTGGDEPFDRFFKVARPRPFFDRAVHELFVRLGKLSDNAAEDHEDASAVDFSVMLGEIVLVDFNEFSLYLSDSRRVLVPRPRRDAFGHAADDEVVVVDVEQAGMEDFLNLTSLFNRLIIREERWIDGLKKFVEAERKDVEQIDHADRIGFRTCQKGSKQAPGGDDVVFVCFLLEVFKRVQRLWAFLDLVEDDERLLRQDLFACNQGKKLDDATGIFIRFKDRFQFVFFVKVEVGVAVVAVLSKLLHEPGLADLPSAFQDHRLAVFSSFPIDQNLKSVAFQGNRLSFQGLGNKAPHFSSFYNLFLHIFLAFSIQITHFSNFYTQ